MFESSKCDVDVSILFMLECNQNLMQFGRLNGHQTSDTVAEKSVM